VIFNVCGQEPVNKTELVMRYPELQTCMEGTIEGVKAAIVKQPAPDKCTVIA
jgi:hypothetical protein